MQNLGCGIARWAELLSLQVDALFGITIKTRFGLLRMPDLVRLMKAL